MRGSLHLSLGGTLLLATATVLTPMQGSQAGPQPANCFQQLAQGRAADLVCEHPAWLSEEEKADLRRLTREMLQDARCKVSVRIERRLVETALRENDHVFEAPPQPVSCEIVTKDSVFPIAGTFAPRVVIQGGAAVEATPGLANVTGVNSYLAWPVVQYVNRSTRVRDSMIEMINAYLSHVRART